MRTPGFGLALVAAFAVGTGVSGLLTGIRDLDDAPNALATIVAVANLVMGVGGIVTAVMVWREDRRALVPFLVWGGSAVLASVIAPLAYSPEIGWPPVLIGGLTTMLLLALIFVYVRRRLTPTPVRDE
jgi:hypothetical protein